MNRLKRKTYYIGLSCSFHDPAVAILDAQGNILFAEATERSIQNKRASGIVCDERQLTLRLLNEFCPDGNEFIISYSWSRAYHYRLMFFSFTGILRLRRLFSSTMFKGIPARIMNGYDLISLEYLTLISISQAGIQFNKAIRTIRPNSIIRNIYHSHHRTHAAYACYTSPFREALCVVMDGAGENGSYSIFRYKDNKLRRFFVQRNLASMGFFYALLTRLCGFDSIKGEEWKVMGLAPYGRDNHLLDQLFRRMIKVSGYRFTFDLVRPWLAALKELSMHSSSLNGSVEKAAEIAHSGQKVFSEIVIKLLNHLSNRNLSLNLVYTGGCALNSSCNGQILAKTNFTRLYVPPAPADDGNAVGAALLSFYKANPMSDSVHRKHSPYQGSLVVGPALKNLLKFNKMLRVNHHPQNISEVAADLIAAGNLVAWVQNKAEFGPRALGNRSILADPRPAWMKDKINSCIKFREEFRPFAPSILHEHGNEYFYDYTDSPFMERTLRFRDEVITKVPAVVHVDQTGRVQSVTEDFNPRFYLLIRSFHLKTGIPLVLNTSLNVMGKPIAHSVEDVIAVFLTSGLDAVVIDDFLIQK